MKPFDSIRQAWVAQGKRARLLALTVLITFASMRAYLHSFPNTDLIVAGYGIHHLFSGLILVTIGGVAAVVLPHASAFSSLAVVTFGVGLSLALDEWLYLIVTDGTNQSYLLPVSLWGGLGAVALAAAYALVVGRTSNK
ncbi:MAG: hypothetical protein ACRD2N_27090 [Vicinamibacterales bacterium]